MLLSVTPRPRFSHAIFDFDGTVSWLRHGWPDLMTSLFLEHLPAARRAGEEATLRGLLLDDILSLNGKPSIHQMIRFTERLREWKVAGPSPERLLLAYETRLAANIAERIALIETGRSPVEEFLVFGVRALLSELAARGVRLFILSGTVEPSVRREAALLGVTEFFGDRIHGCPPDGAPFSKHLVIERILREEGVEPSRLLAFGDGPVEIRFTKAAGGFAVGVASDENMNGSGTMDPWKERQLAEAGADHLIADYRNAGALAKQLFGE